MGRDSRHDRHGDFPDNIKDLLCQLAKDDDNKVTIVLDACEDCILENVEIVSVVGDLAVFRCHDKFKFVNIKCICEVIVDCETILDELFDANSCDC